jgi:diaminopimelate decarboxylase/aspartate kinase
VLAQGELLSSTLGVAYLRSQGQDVVWTDARDTLHATSLPNQNEWSRRLSVSCRYRGDAALRRDFGGGARLLVTQGFHRPRRGRRHRDPRPRRLGHLRRLFRRAAAGAPRRDLDRRAGHVQRQSAPRSRRAPAGTPGLRGSAGNRLHRRQGAAPALHPPMPRGARAAVDPRYRRPDLAGTVIDHRAATVAGVKAISTRSGIVLVSMETIGMWQQVASCGRASHASRRAACRWT